MNTPSNETVEIERDWLTDRMVPLMNELVGLTDTLDIEAKIYEMYITARRAYTVCHLINGNIKTPRKNT